MCALAPYLAASSGSWERLMGDSVVGPTPQRGEVLSSPGSGLSKRADCARSNGLLILCVCSFHSNCATFTLATMSPNWLLDRWIEWPAAQEDQSITHLNHLSLRCTSLLFVGQRSNSIWPLFLLSNYKQTN